MLAAPHRGGSATQTRPRLLQTAEPSKAEDHDALGRTDRPFVAHSCLHGISETVIIESVIVGFADAATEDLWNGVNSARARSFPQTLRQRALDKLTALEMAVSVNDLRVPPSNHLEKLEGDMVGLWSIRVNSQWRITFSWEDGAAGPSQVWLRDYH
jgi:toxin HigB-1